MRQTTDSRRRRDVSGENRHVPLAGASLKVHTENRTLSSAEAEAEAKAEAEQKQEQKQHFSCFASIVSTSEVTQKWAEKRWGWH